MNIVIFGANGAIGSQLVQLALESGHSVTAYVRRPNALTIEHKKLSIVVGSLNDEVAVKQEIFGQDAVLSAMGPTLSMSRKVQGLYVSEAHAVIMRAMKEVGVKRFITLSTPSISAKEDVRQLATVIPSIMASILYPTGYAEMQAIGKLIHQSTLDWTVVRVINPNMKSDGNGYAVTLGDAKGKLSVSRKNVAACMLAAVSTPAWIGKMPIVYNK